MGTTADFAKLRSTKTPKVGEWNIDYKTALAKAKNEGKFIVALWSNGDACGYCVAAEKCLMQAAFSGWMKKQNAYFVFQHSGDKDKGQTVKDWVYKGTGLRYYPGFRISLYDAKGKLVVDQSVEGNMARGNKTGATGAKAIVAYLEKVFAKAPAKPEPAPEPTPEPTEAPYVNSFTDVKEGDWFYDAVMWAGKNGVVTGTEFKPGDLATRGQALTFIWRLIPRWIWRRIRI